MRLLSLATITAAIPASTVSTDVLLQRQPRAAAIHANFTYGSGGTSVDAWVQTSLDGGATWIDIAQFHFTTSSARAVYNLSAETAVAAAYTPTDGTLASNTAKDGILGPLFRVKDQSSGTYAGGTALIIDMVTDQG